MGANKRLAKRVSSFWVVAWGESVEWVTQNVRDESVRVCLRAVSCKARSRLRRADFTILGYLVHKKTPTPLGPP